MFEERDPRDGLAPYFPDMNPIEHGWAKLKESVHERHPGLEVIPGDEDKVRERVVPFFIRQLGCCWQRFLQGLKREHGQES